MNQPIEVAVFGAGVPIPGDGVLAVPVLENEKMSQVDIAATTAALSLNSAVNAHQFLMTETQGNIQAANNITRLTAAKKFDEIGTLEGRAASGVNASPLGPPATKTS